MRKVSITLFLIFINFSVPFQSRAQEKKDAPATWTRAEQTVIESKSRAEKVFAAEVFSLGVGLAGLMDNDLRFHMFEPKQ